MIGKKAKHRPRIILRKSIIKSAEQNENAQISSTILDDCQEEKNVLVKSGFAFYKRNELNVERNWPNGNDVGIGHQIILPGLAEQIESYPCPICANNDRVFMTRAGLEKHANKEHSEENYREIAELAEQIQKEWERRKNGTIVKMDFGQIATSSKDNGQQKIFQFDERWRNGGRINVGNENERFKCDFCNSMFLDEQQLGIHIQHFNHFTQQRGIQQDYYFHRSDNPIQQPQQIHPIYRVCPARVQCEICGLAMVRPSLIIRHMIRVHNKPTNFSANVNYPSSCSLPPLNYRIDRDGNLVWNCCAEDFHDKEILLAHRTQAHPIDQPPNPLLPIFTIQQPNDIAYSMEANQSTSDEYLMQNDDIFGGNLVENMEMDAFSPPPSSILPNNLYGIQMDIGLFEEPEMTLNG